VRLLVAPGQELLCDDAAHVVRAELGAAAAVSGITTRTWASGDGRVDVDRVTAMMRPDAGPFLVSTAAVVVENTHNFGGGTVQALADLTRLREATRAADVRLHLDGARLWNAHVASGVELSSYASMFDTVMVALSKGLGAPVGSLLASTADRIAEARVWRKRLGGGMRQAGILAAAGLYALDHNIARLADDHARARRIAEAIARAVPDAIDLDRVQTNIVVLEVPDAADVAARSRKEGVLISALDARHARFVTHLDVDDAGADLAAQVLPRVLTATAGR
jgi:threonine aldolase